jgi:hypothetical protein
MANAIHKSSRGDTLVTVSKQYYALDGHHGTNVVDLKKVTNAIRIATPFALSDFPDDAVLPAGTTLFVPTLRELNRVVFAEHAILLASLQRHGYDHARKLLHYTPAEVVQSLRPFPDSVTAEDIERAWTLTAFLRLDGMDRYTARYLYDTEKITSIQELAEQSPATLDKILETLVAPPHARPPELATQGHARRWLMSARIQVRKRVGELSTIKGRFFAVPFAPAIAAKQAEFYEAAAANVSKTADEASVAERLARLYRFQSALLRGNIGLRSGNWVEAVAGLQEARRQWHRLAEELRVAETVPDAEGLNHRSSVEVARRLLALLPAEEDAPLGAPAMHLRRKGGQARYRLRGFRYDELNPNRKRELRERLAGVRVHQLPGRMRAAIQRATLGKTRRELEAADGALVQGLVSGADTTLARDFETQDRAVLLRNLGATTVKTLYGGDTGLNLFEALGGDLVIGDIATLLGGLWNKAAPGTTQTSPEPVASLLRDDVRNTYPADFIERQDVTPYTKFLVLPGEHGRTADRFLPLTAGFADEYENAFLKPRLMSRHAEDLIFADELATSPGAFAAVAPSIYAAQIPLGLRQAYGKLNQPDLARRYGGLRTNFYNGDGTLARAVATLDPADVAAFDPHLLACSTDFTGSASVLFPWELLSYAETWIAAADYAYRHDDRASARSYYADVQCAIGKFFPTFGEETSLALTAVNVTIRSINNRTFAGLPADRQLQKLTTLDVVVVQDDVPHRVMEGTFLPVRVPSGSTSINLAARNLASYFEFHVKVERDPVTGDVSQSDDDVPDLEELEPDTHGEPVSQTGDIQIYVAHDALSVGDVGQNTLLSGSAELYRLYLYCAAKIQAIDAGLNWYGYGDEAVPAWSFDHLFGLGRELCNRALDAEQRVFSLLQMYETAMEQEFLAAQEAELAGAHMAVAEAQVMQQVASNALAMQQAELTVQQAAAQAKKSGTWANIATVTASAIAAAGAAAGAVAATIASGGTAAAAVVPAIAAAAPAVAGGIAGTIGNISGHTQDVKVLNEAVDVAAATLMSSTAALTVAIAERDVAALQVEQASAYVDFLLSKDLTSDAYLYLLGLAKQHLELYLYHANRMAWLAERALEHETRQAYDLIKLDYTSGDELADMTRAQQITGDLESLRSEYVAGQTQRLQEIKLTIALSLLDPIAWDDLRTTGTCTFVLRQRTLDMYFPGMFQHRLKDVRLEIVGLVPPEGARGQLMNAGVSWVRVPNEQSFLSDQVEDDWATTALAGSPSFEPYDQYIMKRVLTNVVTLTLSQFDTRVDRAVLSAPQGMLGAVEHLGADAGWTLKLHRQSNNFDFRNIVDVEFTFWFLCAYDQGLEQAQANALVAEGLAGQLVSTATTAFVVHQPNGWSAFVAPPADREALDLRYLTVDVQSLPPWEQQRKLTNILLGCSRALSQTNEITLRLCCDYDPVGFLFTTKSGAIYSLIGVDTTGEEPPPEPDAAFEAWVRTALYETLERPPPRPAKDPQVRWVIKAAPAQVGAGWLAEDEDGNSVSTTSGPLQGWRGGLVTYRDGAAWTNYSLRVKVAHRGGTLRLRLRDDGRDHYALQIAPGGVTLLKVLSGVDTQLGSPLAYAYPPAEYISIDVRVVGNLLSVAVDGITLFDEVDGLPAAGALQRGTIGLQVVATDGARPVVFDDLQVVRLTGKGAEAETLLAEPFTAQLPDGWTRADGDKPWAVAPGGHPVMDLATLANVTLSLDYRYQMLLN